MSEERPEHGPAKGGRRLWGGRVLLISIEEKDPYPTSHVWQLALYSSALLAVVYVPARRPLRRIGYQFRDALRSTSAADEEDTKRREREEELLRPTLFRGEGDAVLFFFPCLSSGQVSR